MKFLFLTLWGIILGIAGGLLLRKWKPVLGWLLVILTLVVAIGVTTGVVICWDAPENPDLEADYALALGCALNDGQATPELIRRCQKALDWMEDHPHDYLIVSGGDPGGQGVAEAAVMAAWLRNHGANAKRILVEDRANDTRENLLYAKALAESHGLEADTVLIITSEYHQTRARYFAEQTGQQAMSLSCATTPMLRLFASVREVYAFVKAVVSQPMVTCTSFVGEG